MNLLTNCEEVQLSTDKLDWNLLWEYYSYYSNIAPPSVGYCIVRKNKIYTTFIKNRGIDDAKRSIVRRAQRHIANYFNGSSKSMNVQTYYCFGYKPVDLGITVYHIYDIEQFSKLNNKVLQPVIDMLLSGQYTVYKDLNSGYYIIVPEEQEDTKYKGLDIVCADGYVHFPNQVLFDTINTKYVAVASLEQPQAPQQRQLELPLTPQILTYTEFKKDKTTINNVMTVIDKISIPSVKMMLQEEPSKQYFVYLLVNNPQMPYDELFTLYKNNKKRIGSTEYEVLQELYQNLLKDNLLAKLSTS